jgi:hypothetical protein
MGGSSLAPNLLKVRRERPNLFSLWFIPDRNDGATLRAIDAITAAADYYSLQIK